MLAPAELPPSGPRGRDQPLVGHRPLWSVGGLPLRRDAARPLGNASGCRLDSLTLRVGSEGTYREAEGQ
jgi:hypothetical protein